MTDFTPDEVLTIAILAYGAFCYIVGYLMGATRKD